jgi:hypothetical protein
MTSHQSQTNETPCWHLHRLADCSCDARFRGHPGEKKKRGVKTGALHDETGYWLSCLVAASATLKDNYLQGGAVGSSPGP